MLADAATQLSETISCAAERKAAVGAIRSKLDRGYDRVAGRSQRIAATLHFETKDGVSEWLIDVEFIYGETKGRDLGSLATRRVDEFDRSTV